MTIALGRSATRSSSGVERYTYRIAVTDLLVIIWAVAGAQLVRFGTAVTDGGDAAQTSGLGFDYALVSVVLVLLWLAALRVHNAYDSRLFGHGPEEYRAVAAATVRLFATLAIGSYLFKLELARGFLLIALPFGLAGLFVSRWLWRRWLGLQRSEGHLCDAMLVVGDRDHLTSLVHALGAVPEAGFRVVGACCSDGDEPIGSIPIVGTEHEAAQVAERLGVDVVACSGSWRLGSEGLRRLGWDLERTRIGLVLAPGMTQVAGPRILTRPVAGLPLLHVEAPTFTGPKRALKTSFDVVGAALIGLLLSPVFLVVAILVMRDGGPVFYRQTRVGLDGEPFTMWKFRSMVTDADLIALCEPDGTFDPEDLRKLLAFMPECDLVIGSRTVATFIWDGANMGWFLRWGNWGVAKAMEVLHNTTSLSDVGCTFRVMTREVAQEIIPRSTVSGSAYGLEMMLLAAVLKIRMVQVPVNYRPRVGVSSVTGDPRATLVLGSQMVGHVVRSRFRVRQLRRHP